MKLEYFEEFDRIDHAFYREKQIQRWSHSKKKALIDGQHTKLKALAQCMNESHWLNKPVDRAKSRATKMFKTTEG